MKTRGGRDTKASLSVDMDLIGRNVALNLINTLRNDVGVALETLQSDKDVLAWVKKMGFPKPHLQKALPPGGLLQSARELRAAALAAVKQKKSGERVQLAVLNHLLAGAASHLELRHSKGSLELHRKYFADSAEQFLIPVAEAVSDLLAHGNFDLVRQCEAPGCVVWFLDRSNGRPRRFCTEDACGTRTRVAAYRASKRNG